MSKTIAITRTIVSTILCTPLMLSAWSVAHKVTLRQDHAGTFDYQSQTTITGDDAPTVNVSRSPASAVPAKLVAISASYDVSRPAVVDADQLNRHLSGVLKNKGQLIIEQCYKLRVCPVFVCGVLIHESGNGSSAFSRNKNNVAGIYDGKRKTYVNFDSVDQCIIKTISLLASHNYAGGKRKTVGEIQKYYCPVGAANDPKGINSHWLGGVLKWMKVVAEDENTYYAIN